MIKRLENTGFKREESLGGDNKLYMSQGPVRRSQRLIEKELDQGKSSTEKRKSLASFWKNFGSEPEEESQKIPVKSLAQQFLGRDLNRWILEINKKPICSNLQEISDHRLLDSGEFQL